MSTAVILEQIHSLPTDEQDALLRALIKEQQQRRRAPVPANRLANRLHDLQAIYGPEPRPDSAAVWEELRADRP
jgi:hypothetical protein